MFSPLTGARSRRAGRVCLPLFTTAAAAVALLPASAAMADPAPTSPVRLTSVGCPSGAQMSDIATVEDANAFTVPANVSQVTVTVQGGSGTDAPTGPGGESFARGGSGENVSGTFDVSPGDVLDAC